MTRWTRFASVGVIGFVVQLLTLHVLISAFDVAYPIAVALSVEAAILHNFVWHERWTWRGRGLDGSADAVCARLMRFNAASGAISLLGNVGFTALFVETIGMPVIVANVLAIVCLTLVNFAVADRLAFAPLPSRARRVVSPGLTDSQPSRIEPRKKALLVSVAAGLTLLGGSAHAADVTPRMIAAWDRYVATVEARLGREIQADGSRTLTARLGQGEIVIDEVEGNGRDAGGGTISHWRGSMFIRGVTLDELLEAAAWKGRAETHRPEDVLDAQVLSRGPGSLRLFLKLRRKAIVTAAYNTEHQIDFEKVSEMRAASRSISTRIAELGDVGTPRERELPPGEDRGFMWRLNSYWRYDAVPGGVVVQLDSLTLSREVPWAVSAIASPIISRIARESMVRTLTSLRAMFGP
jgi:putative flippase GtrA